MKSIRVRPDYSVELPDELRGEIRPGDALEVRVTAGKVTYVRPSREKRPGLREIIDRVRSNPPADSISEEEIEDIVHQVRRAKP